jgi:thiamine-phosphate pyrophosphorylase
MLRYAITNRASFPGGEQDRQAALLRIAFHWVRDGFDYIQLREKDLPDTALASLASDILEDIKATPSPTRLLINSRVDVAIATGAHGVHLTAAPNELRPAEVRERYASAHLPVPIVSVSCHTFAEIPRAAAEKADIILFGPVFEKFVDCDYSLPGQGLNRLRKVCAAARPVPVLALGGITRENAASCIAEGAAGIAGIRLFH